MPADLPNLQGTSLPGAMLILRELDEMVCGVLELQVRKTVVSEIVQKRTSINARRIPREDNITEGQETRELVHIIDVIFFLLG